MQVNGRRALVVGTPLLTLLAACGGGQLGPKGTGGAGSGSSGGILTGGGGGGSWGGGGTGAIDGGPTLIDAPIWIDGGMPTLGGGEANGAWDIAVDATHVYWTDRVAKAVKRVPKGGGETVTMASDQAGVLYLAVDSNYVYWTNALPSGSVMKLPLVGGAPVPVATAQVFPADIAVDATNLYWTNGGGSTFGLGSVMKASLATGQVVTLASNQEAAGAIAIDAASVYWTNGPWEAGGGEAMTVPIAGGTPVRLAQVPSSDTDNASSIGGTSIAVDATSVYFTHITWPMATGAQTVTLKKVPRAGGTEMFAGSSRWIAAPVVDGSALIWATQRAIMRQSSNTTTYTETDGQPLRIAVDQTRIYFTTQEGAVIAVPKL